MELVELKKNDRHQIFSQLDDGFLKELLAIKTVHKFKKGDSLYKEGMPSSGYFFLLDGNVKIVKSSTGKKDYLTNIATSGDLIGGFCEKFDNSAVALGTGSFYFLERNKVSELLQKHPNFAMSLLKFSCITNTTNQNRYLTMLHKSVRDRVLMLIDQLAQNHGLKTNLGIRIDLALTREDLSSMIGVATETLIRVLSDLKNEEVIAQSGKSMIVLKPDVLKS